MTDLFLSYKAEDRARVAPLVQALEADGYSVWWDADIAGGDEWRETICRYLDAARLVIVVWSKRSVGPGGHFVRDEATRALRRGAYLPVRIDKVDPPLGFGETQALNLQGWKGDRSDPKYRELLSAVQRRIGERTSATPAARRPRVDRRTAVIGGAAVALAAVGAGGWTLLKPSSAKADSIAVLPFANLSGDPAQAYFSDGIAEELRSALSRIAGMRVVGRTSSEAVRSFDAQTAARKLGVANILTGSVRQSPTTIRVSAQLVDGRNGLEKWSENYDRAPGDVIKIQTDIAENVARALAIALAGTARAAIALGGTVNAAAQNLVLKAVAIARGGEKDDYQGALSLLDGALSIDPDYAEAHVQKARVLINFGGTYANAEELPRYRAAALRSARRALDLTPSLASAHNALAEIYRISVQFRNANREYRRALDLAPAEATILRDYAQFTSKLGRSAEPPRLVEDAIALDPLNPESYAARNEVLIANRSYAEAVRYSRELLRSSPELFNWPLQLAYCLILLDRFEEVREALAGADTMGRLFGEALLFGRSGNRPEADRRLNSIRRSYGDAASYQYAQVYSQLREAERAFHALERAWQIRDSGLQWLKVDGMLDPLRDDPRFDAIVKRVDFPT